MKKIRMLILCLILSLLLVGCGVVDLTTITQINEDGSGYIMGKIKYDKFASKFLNPIFEGNKRLEEEGFNIKQYEENDMDVIEYKYALYNFKIVSKKAEIYKYININEKFTPGILKNKITLEIKVNKNILKDSIAHITKKDYKVLTPSMLAFISNINYENQVKVPGKILETNGTITRDNNVAKWNYKLNEIDNGTIMTITYTQNQFVYVILIYVFIIVLICAIAGYIFIKKYKSH